jgi:membrane associated rhomboid family serine protease
MTPAAVGIRCPDHAGKARNIRPPRIVARPTGDMLVTRALVAVNIGIYLVTIVQGPGGINNPGGSLYVDWLLYGPFVAQGDWWRLITSMFLHGFLLHIVFNMLALWVIGGPVEQYLGRTRFLILYFVSGLAGSAGALVQSPTSPTVGASGAIFGILGAMLILEWNATGRFGGAAASLIALNLVFNFAYNGAGGNISIGGHIGGLIGGILCTLSFSRLGRSASFGRVGGPAIAGVAAVAIASVLVAYFKTRGLA